MKLRFVWIGKTKSRPARELIDDYLDRLRRFTTVEVTEIRDRSDAGSDRRTIIEKEGMDIRSRIEVDPYVVALGERGRQFSSIELAELIKKHRVSGTKQMTFVVGGPNGLAESVLSRADQTLALSRMTLTHELARVVLAEQAYRAFAIIHDLPYQK